MVVELHVELQDTARIDFARTGKMGPFYCPHCGKGFRNPGGVSCHVAKVHVLKQKPKSKPNPDRW